MNRVFMLVFTFGPFLSSPVWSQEKILKTASDETIEKILKDLDLKFKKTERKEKEGTITNFDFTRGELACRLTNYGSDLWIEWQLDKKMKLEDINRWNAQAKFSRLVLIEQTDKTTTSLEAQLDCLGGVTEPMIRQFINRFDEEAKKFAKTLPK